MARISLKALKKSYGSAHVIKGVDIEVEDGEFCVFVGPSGCGKSTLLRLIAGLEDISSGELRIGETGLAFYEAHNPTDRVIAGTASFNVFPDTAGGYFTKIECFCFTEQVLQPGETVQMPVTFFVDPSIIDDPDAKFVHEITLSYTFHETPLPEENQAALDPSTADDSTAVN